MDVGTVSSTSTAAPIDTVPTQPVAAQPSPVFESDEAKPSRRGQITSELSNLQKSDPEKFKQVAGDIAQKLRDVASGASAGQATFLNKLADNFEKAHDTGDMSSLQPAQGAGHHHGGHHAGVKKYAEAQQGADAGPATQRVDPAQLIDSVLQQDGVEAA